MKKIISMLLAIILAFSIGVQVLAETQVQEETFVPVIRFAVGSDIHIYKGDTTSDQAQDERQQKLIKLLSSAYSYAESDTAYNGLELFAFTGDIGNEGAYYEYNAYKAIIDAGVNADTTKVLTIMGNHEYHTNSDDTAAKQNFTTHTGSNPNEHYTINDYHFIGISTDGAVYDSDGNLVDDYNGDEYSSATVSWVEEQLKSAVAEDATKPIFVFQHVANKDTVAGSCGDDGYASHYTEAFSELFAEYPQIVDFSGHLHIPTGDDCNIHQKDYTSVGVGSLWYTAFYYENGDAISEEKETATNSYYIVEVDAQNNVKISTYNMTLNAVVGEPWIIKADKDEFTYTDDCYNNKTVTFANDAAITVEPAHNSVSFGFGSVSKDSFVATVYKATLKDSSGSEISSSYIKNDYYNTAAAADLIGSFSNLTPETEYSIDVVGINPMYCLDLAHSLSSDTTDRCAAKVSNTLSVSFTTEAEPIDNGEESVSYWNGTTSAPTSGTGIEADPILITNAEELAYIVNTNGGTGKYYKLTDDIYLNNPDKINWTTGVPDEDYTIKEWYETVLTTGTLKFKGTIDGDGHIVYGLYTDTDVTNAAVGLIPQVDDATTIKNLGIENAYFNAPNGYASAFACLVNKALNISGCYAASTVTVKGGTGGVFYGRGGGNFTIASCYSLASVSRL